MGRFHASKNKPYHSRLCNRKIRFIAAKPILACFPEATDYGHIKLDQKDVDPVLYVWHFWGPKNLANL